MKNSFFFYLVFLTFLISPMAHASDGLAIELESIAHYTLLSDDQEDQKTIKGTSKNVPTADKISAGHSHKKRINPCTKLAKWCRSGQICKWDRADWAIFGCGLTTVVGAPTAIYFAKQYLSEVSL